jgi:hypothetical protein
MDTTTSEYIFLKGVSIFHTVEVEEVSTRIRRLLASEQPLRRQLRETERLSTEQAADQHAIKLLRII